MSTIGKTVRALLLCFLGLLVAACGEEPVGAGDGDEDTGRDGGRPRPTCANGAERNACGGCDELSDELDGPCTPDEPPSSDDLCPSEGTWQCDRDDPDILICLAIARGEEVCDGLDNDCDDDIDEDFDLASDPEHCGDCDFVCEADHAVMGCTEGGCVISECESGFVDADGELDTGCETSCTPDNEVDACDGRDNDCDGATDEDYLPIPCGRGDCASTSVCNGGDIIDCLPLEAEADEEESCDGHDEDCDGTVDEGLAQGCENGCGAGELVCSNGELPACTALSEDGQVCIDIQFFCQTIPVTLELPLPTPEDELGVDVAFLFDRSGSFGDDLTIFSAKAQELTDALATEVANLAVGLASFVDAPCSGFGSSGDFGYELNLPLTTDLEQLGTTLSGLTIHSGSDAPESQLEAMYQALTGEGHIVTRGFAECREAADIPAGSLGWRDRSIGYLFVSTDEMFHQPDDPGYPYPHDADFVIAAAQALGIKVFFLIAGGVTDPDANRIAEETGGLVFNLSSDSVEIAETVTAAIFESLSNTVVELVAEGDDLGFVTDITPRQVLGIDLLTNRTLQVTATLLSSVRPTGEVQTYEFDLVFYVNRREITRRHVVVSIPAEDPKDCNNWPPVIRQLNIPESMATSSSVVVSANVDDVDDDPLFYAWEATAGMVRTPDSRDTVFTAPAQAGLVDLTVEVSDATGNVDTATQTVLVSGGECSGELHRFELGLGEGGMVLEGDLNQRLSHGSCGGEGGAEAQIVLTVHRSGRYRFSLDEPAGWQVYIRQRDCATEMACQADAPLELDLDAGAYLLFVDSDSAASGRFRLFAEPVAP